MTVFRLADPLTIHLSSGSCQVDITETTARDFFHELGELLVEEHPPKVETPAQPEE